MDAVQSVSVDPFAALRRELDGVPDPTPAPAPEPAPDLKPAPGPKPGQHVRTQS